MGEIPWKFESSRPHQLIADASRSGGTGRHAVKSRRPKRLEGSSPFWGSASAIPEDRGVAQPGSAYRSGRKGRMFVTLSPRPTIHDFAVVAELVDATVSKAVVERRGSSILPYRTIISQTAPGWPPGTPTENGRPRCNGQAGIGWSHPDCKSGVLDCVGSNPTLPTSSNDRFVRSGHGYRSMGAVSCEEMRKRSRQARMFAADGTADNGMCKTSSVG